MYEVLAKKSKLHIAYLAITAALALLFTVMIIAFFWGMRSDMYSLPIAYILIPVMSAAVFLIGVICTVRLIKYAKLPEELIVCREWEIIFAGAAFSISDIKNAYYDYGGRLWRRSLFQTGRITIVLNDGRVYKCQGISCAEQVCNRLLVIVGESASQKVNG